MTTRLTSRLTTRTESALGVPWMHENAVPRSVQNYVLARWTTSEHADWCMNMRAGDSLNSAGPVAGRPTAVVHRPVSAEAMKAARI